MITRKFIDNFQAGLSRRKVEHLKSAILSCGEKKGATQADIDEVLERKPPSTPIAKCVEACTIEAGGIVSRFLC